MVLGTEVYIMTIMKLVQVVLELDAGRGCRKPGAHGPSFRNATPYFRHAATRHHNLMP